MRHPLVGRAKVWVWAIVGALLLHLVLLDIWSSGQDVLPAHGRVVVLARLQTTSSAEAPAAAADQTGSQHDLSAPVTDTRDAPAPTGRQLKQSIPAQSQGNQPDMDTEHTSNAPAWRPLTQVEAQAQWRMDVLMQVRPPSLSPAGLVLKVALPLGESGVPEVVRSSGREEVDAAWCQAMTEAVRRAPPPAMLDAQGAAVEFEWMP